MSGSGPYARRWRRYEPKRIGYEPATPEPFESSGYIVRSDVPNEGSARIVRFTKRGRAVNAKMVDVLRDIEREEPQLGPKRFTQPKELNLAIVWELSPLFASRYRGR